MKFIIRAICIIVCCLIMNMTILGQNGKNSASGCHKIHDEEQAIYLTYEKLGENKLDKQNNLILRLVNNTDCPIKVETSEDVTEGSLKSTYTRDELVENPIIYSESKYGRVRQEITIIDSDKTAIKSFPEFEDGVLLPIVYTIYDLKNKSIKPGNTVSIGGGCIVNNYVVQPGKSVCLAVDINQIKFADIVVSFDYEWEESFSYQSEHNLYFTRESLPKEIIKKFNISRNFK
jgi:hypothetical protein